MFEIHNAAKEGNLEQVRALIEKNGVNVNTADALKATPLHHACVKGHTETAKLLIEKGAEVNLGDSRGKSPLHLACIRAHTDTAILLLKHKADVNKVDYFGVRPLYYSCKKGNTEMAKLLLKHGADINMVYLKSSALKCAYDNGNMAIVKLLIFYVLTQKLPQEKPRFVKKNKELSACWDEQNKKVSGLRKELGSQLSKHIFDKIFFEEKDLTLIGLSFQFFKPSTEHIKKSTLANFSQSLKCVIL